MRRGEACAVTFDDVDYKNRTIDINSSYIKDTDGVFREVKDHAKTYESARKVRMPAYVFDMIKSLGRKSGYVINLTPPQLYDRFARARDHAGLPKFRYHDLRHYAASYMHSQNVPERYIEKIGGWKPGSNVLKRTYENVLDSELIRIEDAMSELHRFSV